MNIKSLLLGSAAALVAVSGARAADAIEVVAEPEPMEYVRICDTYGQGFYYIPGTETCLRVGGYVRYDIGAGEWGHQNVFDKKDYVEDGVYNENDTYYKRARLSLILDARSETELGTLRAFGQVHFQHTTGTESILLDNNGTPAVTTDDLYGDYVASSQAVDLNHAYIELGGFRIGHTDSIFDSFTGGGTVYQDGSVAYAPHSRTNQIGYTFNAGNGFVASVAIEAPTGGVSDEAFDVNGDGVADDYAIYTLDSYVPNVAAGLGYTAGWGSVKLVGGYDSVWEEFAGKARVDVNVNEALALYAMGGWKSDSDITGDGIDDGINFYGQWEGDWAVWGGASYKASEKATVNLDVGYDDGENLAIVAGVNYTLVPGFTIQPEVGYFNDGNAAAGEDDDNWGGFLHFQRDF